MTGITFRMIVDKRLDFGDVFPQWRLGVAQIGVLTTLTRRFAVLTILPPCCTGGAKRPGVIEATRTGVLVAHVCAYNHPWHILDMCGGDKLKRIERLTRRQQRFYAVRVMPHVLGPMRVSARWPGFQVCLLYTSDAADE